MRLLSAASLLRAFAGMERTGCKAVTNQLNAHRTAVKIISLGIWPMFSTTGRRRHCIYFNSKTIQDLQNESPKILPAFWFEIFAGRVKVNRVGIGSLITFCHRRAVSDTVGSAYQRLLRPSEKPKTHLQATNRN